MKRRRTAYAGVVTALVLAAVAGTGCGQSLAPRAAPNCEDGGRPGSPAAVLMAQSVPTSTMIPCTMLLPVGWKVSTVYAHNEGARFVLSSDRAGANALVVRLQPRCDISKADEVPTDEPGTRRFEHVLSAAPTLQLVRYYTYPGGCTTYDFDLHGAQPVAAATQASLAVGFIRRADVAARVREDSHGRLTLDPPSRGGS